MDTRDETPSGGADGREVLDTSARQNGWRLQSNVILNREKGKTARACVYNDGIVLAVLRDENASINLSDVEVRALHEWLSVLLRSAHVEGSS